MKLLIFINAFLLMAGVVSAETHLSDQKNSAMQSKSEQIIKVTDHPKQGKILTDSKGMTLYMFNADTSDKSTCYDQCAITWPPVLTSGRAVLESGVAGTLETQKRRDGSIQVVYNGMPLYYYIKDKKPGDVYGQNVDSKWFVVNPSTKK